MKMVLHGSYEGAMEILADELAPYWDRAEAEALIAQTQAWGEEKSFLKFIGEW